MRRNKDVLKHFVDENEVQKTQFEGIHGADGGRQSAASIYKQALVERKRGINKQDPQIITKTASQADEQPQNRNPYSTIKFGGGETLVSLDFSEDIAQYMHFVENRNMLPPDFLSNQVAISGRMRQILIDWLIHVQQSFSLLNETLGLTVNLLNNSLVAMQDISKDNLQLLGATCMFVAIKFEETAVPSVEDLIYVANSAFTTQDVLRMERRVLWATNFQLIQPPVMLFLRRYRFYLSPAIQIWEFAKFTSEVAMACYPLAHHLPSTIAAVSLFLAFYTFGHPLNSGHVCSEVFRKAEEDVVSIARSFVGYIIEYIDPKGKFEALRQKYRKVLSLLKDSHLCNLREFGDNLV